MSDPSADRSVRIAAFDVDGTLTTRDCVVPFMRLVGGTIGTSARSLARARQLVPALLRRDRDQVKELASQAAFAGRLLVDVEADATEFAAKVASHWIRPETRVDLERHLSAGDRVVLVSASFDVYLQRLAELLGVDDVLATRLEVIDGGVLSGHLDGANCRADEKVRRLGAWLADAGLVRNDVHVTAYGDSAGDRELLLDADEAHWVGKGSPPAWFPDLPS